MARRFHVQHVRTGSIPLDQDASHHARTVLRLTVGDEVELFDDAGNTGQGEIVSTDDQRVLVRVSRSRPGCLSDQVHIASAVPKGSRADWMIEKLSELGVSRFTPLATERAVVLPEGAGKVGRWHRIAEEAARQSGRAGVMTIDPLTPLDELIKRGPGVFGSTKPPTISLLTSLGEAASVPIAIGPEGGWTDGEIARLLAAGWRAVTLGETILRIETAAIAAAVMAMAVPNKK